MAYTNFTPGFKVQEAQDATAFKVIDDSTWNGESGLTTACVLTLFHYASDGTITQYDDYELITGVDTTKYNEYLSSDGHIVEITDLTIEGDSAGERFEDGYYMVKIIYDDGTYGAGSEPYYENHQAFLAKSKCKARKLPALLSWPVTDAVREKNNDFYLTVMYFLAAEDAADLGKMTEFMRIMDLLNNILDTYEITSCY